MIIKSMETEENGRVALTVTVEKEPFEKAVDLAYQKNGKRMNVPGFRKGKAPRKMIETLYGEGVFYEDAVNFAYPDAVDAAIEEKGLDPVERPDIEVTDLSKEGFTFIARFFVRPTAEIENYTGLTVYKPPVTVEEEEVDHELSHLQERNARMVESADPAQNGDTVILDYEGFVDDVPFDGGKDERATLVLGSGRFIPGFEEQLIGKKAGESGEVKVTFPEEYHAPELSGKEAVFRVFIHEVKARELPVLDDEFAKDVSEFDTLAEFRADMKKKMAESKDRDVEDKVEGQLVDKIVENTTVTVPDPMVEEQSSTFLQNLSYRLSSQGIDFATYLQITQQTPESLNEDMRRRALKQVTANLAFETIAGKENLTVTDEELEEEYQKIAENNSVTLERVKESIPVKSLRRDLLCLKASQLVRAKAIETNEEPVVVDVKAPADAEAPVKKPRAKKAAPAKTAAKENTPEETRDAGADTAETPAE